jgi:HEPN domain-containing protein
MRATPTEPSAWLVIARRDLAKARKDILTDDIPYAVVNLQQATEKVLKAALLRTGWSLAKIHDCAALANELTARGEDLTWFVETAAIPRDEYFAERYPGWSGQISPSRAEAEQYCEAVARVFAQLFPQT